MKIVGIIGAGAAGLCATRHILNTEGLTPLVWEQSAQIGGTWRLSKDVGKDSHGYPVHSSMYEGLRTDLPKVIMKFPDFDFPPEGDSFAHHTTVLQYLEHYADHFKLHPYIKLGHHVESVSPLKDDDGSHAWIVTVKDLSSDIVSTTVCDALIVCNGHFTVPETPEIEGTELYKGQQLHSHDYREPSAFQGSKVVILGAGASGMDIAMELSEVAEKVFLSHNLPVPFPSEMPPNIHQVQGVVKATEKGFYFKDGSFAEVDSIIYCTGYKYSFPFLEDDCGITVENNQVKPLYKQIVNVTFPSMGFIGLPSRIIVFPLINYQVQYYLSVLTGKTPLPTQDEMKKDIEDYAKSRKNQGWSDKHYHILQDGQFPYMEELASLAGVDSPPTHLKTVWDVVIPRLLFSFPTFKSYNYSLKDDGTLIETLKGQEINTFVDMGTLMAMQTVRLLWRDFPRMAYVIITSAFRKIRSFIGI